MANDLRSGFSPNLCSSSDQPSSAATRQSDEPGSTSSGASVPVQGATRYVRASGVQNVADCRRVSAAPSRVVSGLPHLPEFLRCDPHIDLGESDRDEVVSVASPRPGDEYGSSTASEQLREGSVHVESPISVVDSPEVVNGGAVKSSPRLEAADGGAVMSSPQQVSVKSSPAHVSILSSPSGARIPIDGGKHSVIRFKLQL